MPPCSIIPAPFHSGRIFLQLLCSLHLPTSEKASDGFLHTLRPNTLIKEALASVLYKSYYYTYFQILGVRNAEGNRTSFAPWQQVVLNAAILSLAACVADNSALIATLRHNVSLAAPEYVIVGGQVGDVLRGRCPRQRAQHRPGRLDRRPCVAAAAAACFGGGSPRRVGLRWCGGPLRRPHGRCAAMHSQLFGHR